MRGERIQIGAEDARDWAHAIVRKETVGRTLDVGCGTGRFLAPGIAGLDNDAAALAEARDRSHLLVRADAHALPFTAASFDTVYAHRMLNDAGRIDDALAEVRRVLAPGGRLLVFTRARDEATGDRLDRWNGEARLRRWFPSVRVELHPTDDRAAVFVALAV